MMNCPATVQSRKRRPAPRRCLSCGTTENMARRKYCSVDCRQRLRRVLNQRTGLLRALNTRYATFYFTDTVIVMDILLYGETEIFSFIFERDARNRPADDFGVMANRLGNAWWAEQKRTNRKYLASRHVLDQFQRNGTPTDHVRPRSTRVPSAKKQPLTHLKIGVQELCRDDCRERIKRAYRKQVRRHHPDCGGSADMFRKVHEAYQELLAWAETPTFIHRRGFPDKWFYDGNRNRWIQPTPVKAVTP